MQQPTEKPLKVYLRERYGSSTQKLVRQHENSLHRRAQCSNCHIFNMRCRDEGVIPASLRIKPPVKTRQGYRIAECASRAFLSARIRETYLRKHELTSKVNMLQGGLGTELSTADYQKVMNFSYRAAERTHNETKRTQILKLERLANHRSRRWDLHPEGLERWVINLTDRTLTPAQEDVLKLGLNFAPAPSKLPLTDTMATVESGARKLTPEDADDLRGRVCEILRHAKVQRSNLTKEQRTVLKELRGLEDEAILPADKGNATVMMRRCDYDGKMEEMLGTGTYRKLRGDPTATQENRLSRKLKGLEKNGEIRNALYNKLRPTGSQPPRIYGLPKIHKPDIPLRPFVSCIGSPTYQLSKHITSLISPLAGHTSSHFRTIKAWEFNFHVTAT